MTGLNDNSVDIIIVVHRVVMFAGYYVLLLYVTRFRITTVDIFVFPKSYSLW